VSPDGLALFVNHAASDLRADIANAVALTTARSPAGSYEEDDEDGLVYVKAADGGWRVWVPDHEPTRVRVMSRVHDAPTEAFHFVADRTLAKVR